jgi:hypothetical protein
LLLSASLQVDRRSCPVIQQFLLQPLVVHCLKADSELLCQYTVKPYFVNAPHEGYKVPAVRRQVRFSDVGYIAAKPIITSIRLKYKHVNPKGKPDSATINRFGSMGFSMGNIYSPAASANSSPKNSR